MAKFVYDAERGVMVNKDTGEPMVSGDWQPVVPKVFGDLPGYASPITGEWIEGRRARKYDMEKHGCVDANDFSKPKTLKNERFARKHGLTHLLD